MLRRAYEWILGLATHRHALAWLALLAFLESSVLPLAPDILIIPMALATPRRAWTIGAVATAGSVAGGFAGYAIGHFLYRTVGRPLIDVYGAQALFEQFRQLYARWGIALIAAGGFTPLPYKIVTIASGVAGLNPVAFGLAAVISRASRFFLVAVLVARYGQPMRRLLETRLAGLGMVLLFLLLGGFVAFRYLPGH
jgi:membrane protein YqaA with SNARE-associated domain